MMKRMPSVCSFLLLATLMFTGCSIKEDRSGCPCMLVLNLSEVDKSRFRLLTVRAESPDGFLFQDAVSDDGFPDRLEIKVPRTDIRVTVFAEDSSGEGEGESMETGAPGQIRSDGAYIIPESSECPPVYLFTENVNAVSDYVEVSVGLKKNYCRISVGMLAERPYVFGLNFLGNVCGYRADGKPLPGNFVFSSGIRDGETCVVSVPRQTDTSLRMQIDDGEGVAKEFAIGEYIAASGYDWNAEDLEDISIVIDYVRTQITFKVRDWEKVFEFDVTI